jgi:formyltetrahydrofolate synthetase
MNKEYNEWYWKLYRWVRWELPYQPKYIKYGLKNLYKWFWVIWKDRDWDHHYIFEVLKFKLEKQAKHLNERNWHESSKRDAELIMTCVRLINKLQNESYFDELYDSDQKSPEAIKIVIDRHNKARRLLFKIMNDRIEGWWD